MNTENNSSNIINGFVRGEDGKLRANGKLVSKDIAEAALNGEVLLGFDLEALKKKKQRKNAGSEDLVAALAKISPNIEKLKVGMTAKLPIPKKGPNDTKDPKRSFVMSIVTKLNSLTSKGKEWAGRTFDCMADENGDYFYITRTADTDNPPERQTGKRTGAGGAKASQSLQEALAASRAHLNGETGAEGQDGNEGTQSGDIQATATAAVDGAEVVIGGQEGGEVLEEAQVIQH